MSAAAAASHARKVLKQKVKNVNVTSHNLEKRPEAAKEFSFVNSFNAGYEGFSKAVPVPRMSPISGNRYEFIVLFAILGVVPLAFSRRIKHENQLHKITPVSTNKWAKLDLSKEEKQPSKWTL